MNISQETQEILQNAYRTAVRKSHNILEIASNLYTLLDNQEVSETDRPIFDAFLANLKICIEIRKRTYPMTNLLTEITFVIMHIVIWLNTTRDMHIDVNLKARRKSLESDLAKMLEKSFSSSSANIRDRFGLRGVILNKSAEAEKLVFALSNGIVGIMAKRDRKLFSEFKNWIETSSLDSVTKLRIETILDLPFQVEFYKDFISTPKNNGYQSLQYTLTLDMTSRIMPGAQVEIQLRTESMNQTAEFGSASHENDYKAQDIKKECREIFTMDNFDNVSVVGFSGYTNTETDFDGVHFAKLVFNRRISSELVLDFD